MGGGGKSSQTQTSSPYAGALWATGNKWQKTAFPLFSQMTSNAEQAIQTGGVNSNIPSINRAVDASRQAATQSQNSTRQSLARLGLENTPFAQTILAQNQQTSGQQIASAGPTQAQAISSMAPGLISTGMGGISAMSSAAGLDTTTTYNPGFWQSFVQGLQGASSGVGEGVGAYFGA